MARQVLPIVGAVVGAFFGAPQLGYAIGAIIGNAVDPQVIKGPKIGEAGVQTSAEGVFRPVVLGVAPVKGNVIERGNRQVRVKRTRQGKGGGPVTEEERVYWTFAIRIAEGPIGGLLRIWQDEKIVYDMRPDSDMVAESNKFARQFRLYLGDEEQLPDPDIEVYRGEGNTPAYRGTAYIVFPNFDLTDRRESIPDFRFEVSQSPVDVGATWYRVERYTGDGEPLKFLDTIDLSNGGMVIVSRMDEAEMPTIYFSPDNGPVREMPNHFPLTYAPPVPSTAQFTAAGVSLPMNTAGGDYSAQIFQVSTGNFRITPYLGTGIAGDVIPHGLGTTPKWHFTRPTDDPTYSISFLHLLHFDGEGAYVFNQNSGFDADGAQQWDNTAPNALAVTLGWHPQINGDGMHYLLFAMGGPDIVTGTGQTASAPEINLTFPPRAVILKRREIAPGWNWGMYSNYEEGVFGGPQTEAVLSAPLAGNTNTRFLPTDVPYQYTVTEEGVGWNDQAFDWVAIRGVGPSDSALTLADVVAWNYARIGLDASQYDVSELTDSVFGIVFAGDYTAADAVRTLMLPYFFDAAEFDAGAGYRIHHAKRGKPVVEVLTENDLLALPETAKRYDPLERPKTLHLAYENPTIGYAPAKATVRRDSADVHVVGERSLQIPVCIEDVDEAAQRADKLMRIVWAEVDGEEEFAVPESFLHLVPGDCVGVVLRGESRRMRIVEQSISGGEIRMRMLHDRQSAYTSNVTGIPVPLPTPPLPTIVGNTVYEFMDLPALSINDDRLVWYDAAAGQTPAWFGAQTQHKAGASLEFEDSARFSFATTMGVTRNAITASDPNFTDHTNVLEVALVRSDMVLDSLTEAEFLSKGGAFALENPDGTWEILQYQNAVETGDGTFLLSPLARGRLNTPATAHAAGARFVRLDGVLPVDAAIGWLNTEIQARAISITQDADEAPISTHDYVGRSQIEFPVAEILVSQAGDTLTARAIPRHRLGTEINPVRSLNWSGYRWSVTDGANVFTTESLTDTIAVDVTGWASPVTVTVAQLNRFTGAGPSVSEVFP